MGEAQAWTEWLARWPGAVWLQGSGTGYLFVNAAHILGLGLLVGAMLPLDLRLATNRGGAALSVLGPWAVRIAGCGLALALVTGAWLFSVQPAHYLENPAFLCKMALLGLALANVAWQHRAPGLAQAWNGGEPTRGVRARAGLSFVLWLAVLVAGRWIGFV